MNIKELSSNSLCFIGDAVYTLNVRLFFIGKGYQSSKKLQYLCNKYNSAKGQRLAYEYLKNIDFFNDDEKNIFKRGRNSINHIPKNSDLVTYELASGLEGVVGYLYISNKKRFNVLFDILKKEVFIDE